MRRFIWFLSALMLPPVWANAQAASQTFFGYGNFAHQVRIDAEFLAVPSRAQARADLKTLTAVPHIAGSEADYKTALFVAAKFRAAGLRTRIVPYVAWINLPKKILVRAYTAKGKLLMTGPTPEYVAGDRYDKNPNIVMPFNGSSPSADITAGVVYANYGRPQDFAELARLGVSVKGKIVIARYGKNYRGVKVYIAQQEGAAGVILYSDPADTGYFRGSVYPNGPYLPATGVQRGAVEYLFEYPGDVTTPGVASTPSLPMSQRIPPSQAAAMPKIPATPLSWHDAAPILRHLGGPAAPRGWQGALPFTYHVGGTGQVKVHMLLRQDYKFRTLWDVIGSVRGSEYPDAWVIAGNHRDAWVFGAVDPSSGTAAMLEAVRGVGVLLKTGWRPKRTMVFASWDGEEEGLIGSTEWVEAHPEQMKHTVAYFNMDIGVSGPDFEADAVPSLKQFVREVTMQVPSASGEGSVYQRWVATQAEGDSSSLAYNERHEGSAGQKGVRIGDLGSGSDFTPFLQHAGVPSTDITSSGPYGVYHSAFDDYQWFVENADPTFAYEQQQARVFGLEALDMADADVLPYDYVTYAHEIGEYLVQAEAKAAHDGLHLNFTAAKATAKDFLDASEAELPLQEHPTENNSALNAALRQVAENMLTPWGLPGRPWYKQVIYAPGVYTGYAAVVLPGVNGAINAKNATLAQQQLGVLTMALNRATATLRNIVRQKTRN